MIAEAGDEEQGSGERGGEIEDPIGVPGRTADEDIREHLLDHVGSARVGDEVRAVFVGGDPTERHVEAQDLLLLAVVVLDDGQR